MPGNGAVNHFLLLNLTKPKFVFFWEIIQTFASIEF